MHQKPTKEHDTPHDSHRSRFFAHGNLRLITLDILTGGASHGYELIKAIEALTKGHYTPSPGVVYPTLDYLQQHAFIEIEEESNGRKKYAITDNGRFWLDEQQEQLAQIHTRIKARTIGHELRRHPELKRALDHLKSQLDVKVNRSPVDADRLNDIIAIIDRAADDIAGLN